MFNVYIINATQYKILCIQIPTAVLRVFENRVLRRVFGPKRDEVTGKWRKLHKEELRDLYSLPKLCGW